MAVNTVRTGLLVSNDKWGWDMPMIQLRHSLSPSILINFVAIAFIIAGYLSQDDLHLFKSIGFFALSGAVTNWLAIHMLFEKVPFLYGSGVIPSRFEEFKQSVKELMMSQFFTRQNISRFIEIEEQRGAQVLNLEPLLNVLDYERIYQELVAAIMKSSIGSVFLRVSGEEALTPLKKPMIDKIRSTLTGLVSSRAFSEALRQGLDANKISIDVIAKIETVIDQRLDELTPLMVRDLLQGVMHGQLSWLVVWGGFFGGLMGAIVGFL